MPYLRNSRALTSLSGFSENDQCSVIPIGDPYRKPGNYCATPDGGMTTFNSDGSTYRVPGAVDPDPAHPAGSSGSQSTVSKILGALFPTSTPMGPTAPMPSGGISTSTALMIGGGVIFVVLLATRRRPAPGGQ